MDTHQLMAISPLDGRYSDKVDAYRAIFSEYGLIRFRLQVEIEWLLMLASHGHIKELSDFSQEEQQKIKDILTNFNEDDALRVKAIESQTNHDVKAIEYFIKEKLEKEKLGNVVEWIHFGCTSEDINNLAYGLMLDTARKQCLLPSLDELIAHLTKLAHKYADLAMLSRTHGQPATPTTLGKEIANVIYRLRRQIDDLIALPILGKLNGASGNYNALHVVYPKIDWQVEAMNFVNRLGLTWNPYTTQIEPHDTIAEFFSVVVRINNILIDFNRDIWSYIAIEYFNQKMVAHEVGSSTMPHKINPIDFENAEGNLGIANATLTHMMMKLPISRWQRDLSDSTVLRNMGVALTHSVLAYQSTQKGLKKLEPNLVVISDDLDAHWEVLTEAIQMMMRRFNISEPYEKLKAFSRGKKIDREVLHQFIEKLDIPENQKQYLLDLTPKTYLGYAEDLAKRI